MCQRFWLHFCIFMIRVHLDSAHDNACVYLSICNRFCLHSDRKLCAFLNFTACFAWILAALSIACNYRLRSIKSKDQLKHLWCNDTSECHCLTFVLLAWQANANITKHHWNQYLSRVLQQNLQVQICCTQQAMATLVLILWPFNPLWTSAKTQC